MGQTYFIWGVCIQSCTHWHGAHTQTGVIKLILGSTDSSTSEFYRRADWGQDTPLIFGISGSTTGLLANVVEH